MTVSNSVFGGLTHVARASGNLMRSRRPLAGPAVTAPATAGGTLLTPNAAGDNPASFSRKKSALTTLLGE